MCVRVCGQLNLALLLGVFVVTDEPLHVKFKSALLLSPEPILLEEQPCEDWLAWLN